MDEERLAQLEAAGVPPAILESPEQIRLRDGGQIQGMSADRWLKEDPSAAPEIALALGALIRRLHTVRWGPSGGWAARWQARVQASRAYAQRERLHLGAPLDRLLHSARLPPDLPIPPLVPVHGRLGLDRVWLDPGLRPITLLGIEGAEPGDGLVDTVSALRFRDPALRQLALEATGLRDGPGIAERLRAYLPGDLLAQLANAPADPLARAATQEQVRLRLPDAHDPRLALRAPRLAPDRPALAVRLALEQVAEGIEGGASWVGALGASLLAVGLPDDLAGRFGLVALELAQHAGIPAASPPERRSPSAAAVGLAQRGVRLLDEAVGDHILSRLGPVPLPAPVDAALQRALTLADDPHAPGPERAGEPLPLALLQSVVDDPLDGDRAALPATAWAAQVLHLRGWRAEGRALLRSALHR